MEATQTPMEPLLDAVLFLGWVSAYLMAVAFAARYRRAKPHPPSEPAYCDYRADKDGRLRISMLVLGLLLCYLTYLASTGIRHLL